MFLAEALIAIHKGQKITSPDWIKEGYHIYKDELHRLVWFNGSVYEPVEVTNLAIWIQQADNDWIYV